MPSGRQIQHYGQYGLQARSPGNSLLFLVCTRTRQIKVRRGVRDDASGAFAPCKAAHKSLMRPQRPSVSPIPPRFLFP